MIEDSMRPKPKPASESNQLVVGSHYRNDVDSLVISEHQEGKMKKKTNWKKQEELVYLRKLTGGKAKLIDELPRAVYKQSDKGN